MSESDEWMRQAVDELAGAHGAWGEGNAGRGRVGARRAAGMAIKALLAVAAREGYGKNFMHHLNALADDEAVAAAVREAAWRLAARQPPAGGFAVALPERLTPMHDVDVIMAWCQAGIEAGREAAVEAGTEGSGD